MAKKCIKIYESIVYPELHSFIYVDGKRVELEFTGHMLAPKKVNGRFVTDKQALQVAMEADPRYGKQWRCVKTNWVETETPDTPELKGNEMFAPGALDEDANPKIGEKVNSGDGVDVKDILGVTNVTGARARLSEKANVSVDELPTTKAEIIQWANEHGFNLVGYAV